MWFRPAAIALAALTLAACDLAYDASKAPALTQKSTSNAVGPAEGNTSAVREAFDGYRKAMRDGDLDAIKSALVPEKAAEFDKHEPEDILPVLKMMLPQNEKLLGVDVNGEEATIRLEATEDGAPSRGEITLKRLNGEWKVEYEAWKIGNAAIAAGDEPEPIPVPEGWKPSGKWTLDLSQMKVPTTRAGGRVMGRDFPVTSAVLENNVLTLSDGDVFEFNSKIIVFLFTKDDKPLIGSTLAVKPKRGPDDPWDLPSAHVHMHSRSADTKMGFETVAATEGFALRISFDQVKDGKAHGRIYLCYPDDEKSYVAGSFVAAVK